jgi:hypothetical protein
MSSLWINRIMDIRQSSKQSIPAVVAVLKSVLILHFWNGLMLTAVLRESVVFSMWGVPLSETLSLSMELLELKKIHF